jgi:mannose-1-phosphate guanylyltransferase/phosphomannomutase
MSDWFVLAGGFGTRSANPDLPKILQQVGEFVVLDFLIHSLNTAKAKNVVFVLHHGNEQVRAYLLSVSKGINFSWNIFLDEGSGPVQALVAAVDSSPAEQFGVILGDSLISAPLENFFNRYQHSGKRGALVARQSNHVGDSDVFALTSSPKESKFFPKSGAPNTRFGMLWSASGVLFLDRSLALTLDVTLQDVSAAMIASVPLSELEIIKSSFYHRDTGTPARLQNSQLDLKSGALKMVDSGSKSRKAVFMDRDGTLIPDIPDGRVDIEQGELNPTCINLLRYCRRVGIPVFLVTNQPQCAKGFISKSDVYFVHNKVQQLLLEFDCWFDDIEFCPHHPSAGFPGEDIELKIDCACRKPKPGMISLLASNHNVDILNSIVVGDSWRDSMLSKSAGARFIHVDELARIEDPGQIFSMGVST